MKQIFFLLIISLISLNICAQKDTVFIKYSNDSSVDTLNYVTDTVLFPSSMARHILVGTSILPETRNQQIAKSYGLFFDKVTKSDCQSHGEEVYRSKDKINSIVRTDSTLTVDINIYNNCCYDFLCDISVDSLGTLCLIYHGYGTYCACDCCFGLTYHFKIDSKKIKAVMLSDDKRTMKKIK